MTQLASSVPMTVSALQGMAAGSVVMTSDGGLPVEHLTPGDRIVTRSGLRRLRAVVVAVADFAMLVRIGKDTLGVGRPETAIIVGPGQPVLIRDWRAQALFGQAQAMVPAQRLVDGTLIALQMQRDARLFMLEFDMPEVAYVGGLQLGCASQTVTA